MDLGKSGCEQAIARGTMQKMSATPAIGGKTRQYSTSFSQGEWLYSARQIGTLISYVRDV